MFVSLPLRSRSRARLAVFLFCAALCLPLAGVVVAEDSAGRAPRAVPTLDHYVKASNTGEFDGFGWATAISGNTLVVGATGEQSSATGVNGNQSNNSASSAGAAYVFVRSGNTWVQQAYLKASNAEADDSFGVAVAISGDTIVVGATGEDSASTGVNGPGANNAAGASGAAYVFVRSGTTWSQQAYLKASNTGADDRFGIAVAVSGDTIVVGASGEDSNATTINGNEANETASGAGAAYVFTRSGTTWSQQAYIKASNAESADLFGTAVGLSGETAVITAPGEDSFSSGVNGNQASNGLPGSGAVYAFVRSGSTWSQQVFLKSSQPVEDDGFGSTIAISGDTVVVGAGFAKFFTGEAEIFARNGTTWAMQARLDESDFDEDSFGWSVAIDGDAVVVGAWANDSDATTVNGDEANNNATDAGAAYLYTRSGTTWTRAAFLKAPNADVDDRFGYSVGIDGNFVIVGAPGEASNATGVDGNQGNNSASFAGAVYTFSQGASTPHDVNGCDGNLDSLDALAVLRVLAGFTTGTLPTPPCTADFDASGDVDLADAIAVRRELAGF